MKRYLNSFCVNVLEINFSLSLVHGKILCFKKKTRIIPTATYTDYATELWLCVYVIVHNLPW